MSIVLQSSRVIRQVSSLLILFLSLSIINPVSACESSPIQLAEVMTEFTLVENSIGGGYYIPWYSHVHYAKDGSTTVYRPDGSELWVLSADRTPQVPVPGTRGDAGYRPATWVYEVPSGSHADYNYTTIPSTMTIYYNETPILWADWDELNDNSSGETIPMPMAQSAPDSWVIWADIIPNIPNNPVNYNSFTTNWVVPRGPEITQTDKKIKKGDVFYIFNGLESKVGVSQPNGFDRGIIQPILTWNCGNLGGKYKTCTGYPLDARWTGAAWIAPEKGVCVHGDVIPVSPGDIVKGDMEWTGSNSKSWNVRFTNTRTGQRSQLLNQHLITNDAKYTEPVVTLENYRSKLVCADGTHKDHWPRDPIKFTDFKLTTDHGTDITRSYQIIGRSNPERFVRVLESECFRENRNPIYDPDHYFIYTRKWPNEITFQTQKAVNSDL